MTQGCLGRPVVRLEEVEVAGFAFDLGSELPIAERRMSRWTRDHISRSYRADLSTNRGFRPPRAVLEILPGGADHVFEAIGLVATVELAFALARPGGTVTLVGMTPAGYRASFDVYRFVASGGRVLGSSYGSAVPATAFPMLAACAMDGRLPIDQLITERIALEQLPDAFDAMRRRDGARRVIMF